MVIFPARVEARQNMHLDIQGHRSWFVPQGPLTYVLWVDSSILANSVAIYFADLSPLSWLWEWAYKNEDIQMTQVFCPAHSFSNKLLCIPLKVS